MKFATAATFFSVSVVSVDTAAALQVSGQQRVMKGVQARVSRERRWLKKCTCKDCPYMPRCTGEATYGSSGRRELDGEDATNTSITGSVIIGGYSDGIDPFTGAANTTLLVENNLQGCNNKCSALKFKNNPNFCEEVVIGDLDLVNSAGDVVIIQNITPIASDIDTDVGTAINQLFDRPLVVQDSEGRVLACAMFKEVAISNSTDANTQSGALSSGPAAWVFFVASAVVIAAVL